MLKGKKNTYILLAINLFIWSYAGYKVYKAFGEEETFASSEIVPDITSIKEDSVVYVLDLNYDDPFLKEEPKKTLNRNAPGRSPSPLVKQESKKIAPKEIEKKVEIKYFGIISNKSTGSTTALVSFNGTSYIMKKGDVIEGARLELIDPDILTFKMGKEKILINKS
jgi:hypothetical protein